MQDKTVGPVKQWPGLLLQPTNKLFADTNDSEMSSFFFPERGTSPFLYAYENSSYIFHFCGCLAFFLSPFVFHSAGLNIKANDFFFESNIVAWWRE